MKLNDFFRSKTFYSVLYGIGVVVAAMLIFQAGVFVGYRKASFSYRWGENYHRNFGGPPRGFVAPFMDRDFANPHGTFGKIIKIELPIFTVQGTSDAEKIILIKDDTVLRRFQETIKSTDLKIGDNVVVIGEPNDKGQVEAKFIRIMPTLNK